MRFMRRRRWGDNPEPLPLHLLFLAFCVLAAGVILWS